jgi:uncharacterized membrane protein YcgQ (UPF0703/DUF1980 family)
VADRNGTVAGLNDLIEAANDEGKRQSIEGQTAILDGRIRWIDARQFTLFRLKMTCCAADIVPMKVRIVLMGGSLSNIYDFEWIQLKGRIQFVQAPNSDRYIPVIVIQDLNDVHRIESKNKYE